MPDTADLMRVVALSVKGYELKQKGHFARSVEKFSCAAEEADKVLPGPDSLVTCALRHDHLDALIAFAVSTTVPADADDALRMSCLRLLPPVIAVLERRKAAGTLLPGSCRPEEETFQMAVARRELELGGDPRASAAKLAALIAPHVGVETYLRSAGTVAFMLNNMDTLLLKRAFVLSDEQIDAGFLFLTSALDLMTRPRSFESWVVGEPDLVNHLRTLIPKVSSMDEPATKKLCVAWRCVLRSGVLRARGIDEAITFSSQQHQRIVAARGAEVAAGMLQQCALAGCGARESHASQFKRCGACRAVCYCCREHQVEDWPSHKAACKAARKEAADAGAAAADDEA